MSGDSIVTMSLGDKSKGIACRVSHPAVPKLYVLKT